MLVATATLFLRLFGAYMHLCTRSFLKLKLAAAFRVIAVARRMNFSLGGWFTMTDFDQITDTISDYSKYKEDCNDHETM
eukprot:5102068-Pleurochrysis_carterae.AAC.1